MDFEKDLSTTAIIIHGKQYHVSKGVRSIKFWKLFRWRREKSDLARIDRLTETAMIVSANLRASDVRQFTRGWWVGKKMNIGLTKGSERNDIQRWK